MEQKQDRKLFQVAEFHNYVCHYGPGQVKLRQRCSVIIND